MESDGLTRTSHATADRATPARFAHGGAPDRGGSANERRQCDPGDPPAPARRRADRTDRILALALERRNSELCELHRLFGKPDARGRIDTAPERIEGLLFHRRCRPARLRVASVVPGANAAGSVTLPVRLTWCLHPQVRIDECVARGSSGAQPGARARRMHQLPPASVAMVLAAWL